MRMVTLSVLIATLTLAGTASAQTAAARQADRDRIATQGIEREQAAALSQTLQAEQSSLQAAADAQAAQTSQIQAQIDAQKAAQDQAQATAQVQAQAAARLTTR